ncbi:MAG: hypothetical protein ACOCV1_06900 [Bacillota bacterium]
MNNFKVGDTIKIKTYNEIMHEYPNENWNDTFFHINGNKIRKILEVNSNWGTISCKVLPPWGDKYKEETLGVDIRAVKKISQLELDDKLFEI